MTNEQLALLLSSIRDELQDAITKADANSTTLERHKTWTLKGDSLFVSFDGLPEGANESDWESRDEHLIAHDPLYDLLRTFDAKISWLK